ncbi:Hypothetical protein CINCED_3A000678 [Cinara cedri]|uniref:Uncharacterized protein n=1 Tax=Cinara cedri TaxID=506608 RepID=A0A5E4N943_9HEMI|nr:Hypothetical protein CINCED_3A000678 [Cinara cedri]
MGIVIHRQKRQNNSKEDSNLILTLKRRQPRPAEQYQRKLSGHRPGKLKHRMEHPTGV